LTVAVLGGGFAGLQAAITLRERGIPVVLLERRGILGGRASSYRDARSGDEVDNGVHVLFGAHAVTLDLIRRAGADSLLLEDTRSGPAWSDGRRRWTLSAAPLPTPWHLLPGLLAMRLPGRDTLAVWRLLRRGKRGELPQEATLAREVESARLGRETTHRLIEPLSQLLCLARPEAVTARLFGAAVRASLLASRQGARPLSFRYGLAELHERLGLHLEAIGGRVIRGARAESLELRDGRVVGVRYRQRPREREEIQRGEPGRSERIESRAVVSAIPWHGVAGLLPEAGRRDPCFASLDRLAGAPAVSVTFWLSERVLRHGWLGIVGSEVCRVGARERGEAPDGSRQMLQALLLPSLGAMRRSNSQITTAVDQDLVAAIPGLRDRLQRSLVVRDPTAAFAQTPDASSARPGPATPLPGLFLAGDWTDTGLPTSIEGAVRSGRAAAVAVSEELSGRA